MRKLKTQRRKKLITSIGIMDKNVLEEINHVKASQNEFKERKFIKSYLKSDQQRNKLKDLLKEENDEIIIFKMLIVRWKLFLHIGTLSFIYTFMNRTVHK